MLKLTTEAWFKPMVGYFKFLIRHTCCAVCLMSRRSSDVSVCACSIWGRQELDRKGRRSVAGRREELEESLSQGIQFICSCIKLGRAVYVFLVSVESRALSLSYELKELFAWAFSVAFCVLHCIFVFLCCTFYPRSLNLKKKPPFKEITILSAFNWRCTQRKQQFYVRCYLCYYKTCIPFAKLVVSRKRADLFRKYND